MEVFETLVRWDSNLQVLQPDLVLVFLARVFLSQDSS